MSHNLADQSFALQERLKARKYERLENKKKGTVKPKKDNANGNGNFLTDLDDQEFDYVDVDNQN